LCRLLIGRAELQVVGEATDGLEAVQEIQELKPDLVLLDVGLPNLNGIEAASRIRQIAPGTKIVFVTQEDDLDVAREALNGGAQAYVLKDEVESDLLPAIEAVLGGSKFVSNRLHICA
ncbi:MAG TPA: response regulator transcription factor, partial [Candidatus Bathyarchaeia archaeon]|nr:response regulator transcription factor [Candidatus Bathyarchaeia archaeon]